MRSAVGALWPDEAVEAIHLTSLELLERAGVRVESQAARTLLTRAGCREGHGGRLLMPRERGRRSAGRPARVLRAGRPRPRSLSGRRRRARRDLRAQHGWGGRRVGRPDRREPAGDARRPGRLHARHAPARKPARRLLAAAAPGRARRARAALLVPHGGLRDRQVRRRPRHLAAVPGALPARDGDGADRRDRRRRALSARPGLLAGEPAAARRRGDRRPRSTPWPAVTSWSRSCRVRRWPRRLRPPSPPPSPSRTPRSWPASWRSRRSPPVRRPTTVRVCRRSIPARAS